MPINYARRLSGPERTAESDRHLGFALAFVAGAANAGGFLAVRQYTSHMTGIVSAMADHLVLAEYKLVLVGVGGLVSFLAGAAVCSVMVNFARRAQLQSVYALPLLLEALLLLVFGLLGAQLSSVRGLFVPMTVMLLCFIMGLQNAVISKLSNTRIRTTHMTGVVTDIGIEIGKALYWNQPSPPGMLPVAADRSRLTLLSWLFASFMAGGIAGALGFKHAGYGSTVVLALILTALACVPIADDLQALLRRRTGQGL